MLVDLLFFVWLMVLKCTAVEPSFGVQDSLLDRFVAINRSSTFACLGADVLIMGHQVNDDYCDCPDGSDEPGTSACPMHGLKVKPPPEWSFRCTNAGFEPQSVPHNRVNDGICDCCDGSDEYAGIKQCPNVCAVVQEAERKRLLEEEHIRQMGINLKEKMAKKAEEDLERTKVLVSEESSELQQKNEALEKALQRLSPLEEEERVEKQRLQDAYNVAHAAWMEEGQRKNNDLRKNSSLACVMWRATMSCDTEDGETLLDKDCDEIIEGTESGHCECHDKESDAKVTYEKECDHTPFSCSYVCENNGEHENFSEEDAFSMDDGSSFELPEANYVRHEISELRSRIDELSTSLEAMQKRLSRPINTEDLIRTLGDECFSVEQGSHRYEMCPFKTIHQYSNGSNYGPCMGRWGRFGKSTYSLWATTDDYTHMLFENGDTCWNGMQRTTDVHVICGMENKLMEVEEPSMCKYTMVFQTPAICE